MKYNTIILFVVTTLASLLPSLTFAQYEGYSTSRLLVELGELLSEARSAESEVKASLAARDRFARELQDINRETDSYKRDNRRYQDDLADHNDSVDDFNENCGSGSFDQAALDRCESLEADLTAAQNALDARRDELEEQRIALQNRMEEYNSRERERAGGAEAQLSRYDEINNNINAMFAELQNKEALRGSPCFMRPSPESRLQCLIQASNNR